MRTWLMKRNCSFSPKQVGWFYLSIVSFSLLVAGYFLLIGVWMIIIFTVIEILALTIALYVYSKHALDYEKIMIDGKRLLVERSWGGKIELNEFNTVWTKLIHKKDGRRDLVLVESTKELAVGYFVPANQQEQFERDLGGYLGI